MILIITVLIIIEIYIYIYIYIYVCVCVCRREACKSWQFCGPASVQHTHQVASVTAIHNGRCPNNVAMIEKGAKQWGSWQLSRSGTSEKRLRRCKPRILS